MPHRASTSFLAWLPAQSIPAAKSFQLTASQAPVLTQSLNEDAKDLHYSATISLLDALNGINSAYFSWATVKLYYCCFYCVRSLLASNGVGIVYVPNNATSATPFSIKTSVNMVPHVEKGVTHKIVWKLFEKEFANNPLLGDIGLVRAYTWMTALRESVNYKNPRFQDPVVPNHFNEVDRTGINAIIKTYFSDDQFLYAFDADHAALAFPIECLKRSRLSLEGSSITFNDDDINHTKSCLVEIGLDEEINDFFFC